MSIIMLLIIIAFIFSIVKVLSFKRRKYISSHRAGWIFGGYIVILLFCTVLVALIPTKEMADTKKVNVKDLEKEGNVLFEDAQNGRIDKVNPDLIEKKWDIHYSGRKLTVNTDTGEPLDNLIFVERKKSNDDKIEALFYKTRSSMNGMDISELKRAPSMSLMGDTLTLKKPKLVKVEIYQFQNSFPVSQFTNEQMFNHHTFFSEGQSILYLRIPKDLEITDTANLNLQYVN